MLKKIENYCDSKNENTILCFYQNATNQIQIIRLNNIEDQDFAWKRVVFPGQRLIFEATCAASLEILLSDNADQIIANIIYCKHLMVIEK